MSYLDLIDLMMNNNIKEILHHEEELFLLIPELKACKGFNQNSKYHIYDVYEHILHVISNISNNKVLKLVALFHDIGKPLAYTEDINHVGHFYNHWYYSKEIFMRYETNFNLNDKEIELIRNLIFYHDIDINSMNKQDKDEMVNKIGLSNLYMLFNIKRADLLAQSSDYHYQLNDINEVEDNLYREYNVSFINEICELENTYYDSDFIYKKGSIPILFSAPHTMRQEQADGKFKYEEPFTKGIALYLNKEFNVNVLVKNKDTGLDSNRDNNDEYKNKLINIIKENNIKLVIDLHGADRNREFDIELGTLNNLSADYSTVNELVEAFNSVGINLIEKNDPFKGGAITQYVYFLSDIDVIQIEINGRLRNINNPNDLKKVVDGFSCFIKQYNDYLSNR